MITFPDLAEIIIGMGECGRSLASLAASPTSASLVGILASRVNFQVQKQIEYEGFDLFVCSDNPSARLPLRSPFGIICLDPEAAEDVPRSHGVILDALEENHLQERPALLLHRDSVGEWAMHLDLLPMRFSRLSSAQIVTVMLAHPPRTASWTALPRKLPCRR